MNKVIEFKSSFQSNHFILISPEALSVITSSLPENKIDARRSDTIGEDIQKPTRLELYYKHKHSKLIVKVNIIYSPLFDTEGFISMNSISSFNNENIDSKYKNLYRPLLDEFLFVIDGDLIHINFFLSQEQYTESDVESFNESAFVFYQEFEEHYLNMGFQRNRK
ncbi:hypothetical protein LQV63_30955 [Paenibacillus profundus]|uniref:Uncharacterized protein n=1 Tax=Paenibacillus profundus TaxID=1173085 RepID=A0ABS8YVK3_9BACL|nr:hypothetical protein [Paenibacillus profundus]MCE5173649.1 hypothetical protein [Paenibacillus profundus]